mmetsp:Transcript_5236/g.12332  ORF Transcript_5236/g.12332 Transcript_5236/m.12332 type:complete len:92 (-) Transcript_5236:338-613(-)
MLKPFEPYIYYTQMRTFHNSVVYNKLLGLLLPQLLLPQALQYFISTCVACPQTMTLAPNACATLWTRAFLHGLATLTNEVRMSIRAPVQMA